MQDVLGLGSEYRMNTPGTMGDNWQWRFNWEQLPAGAGERLRHYTHLYGRTA
jgi:4-alpha-glucanotransferase